MTIQSLKLKRIQELLGHIASIRIILDDMEHADKDLYTSLDRAFLKEIEQKYKRMLEPGRKKAA